MVLVSECGRKEGLHLLVQARNLDLWVVPTLGQDHGRLLVETGRGRRGWILAGYESEPRVLAHLFLHLVYGLPGYGTGPHPAVFTRCGLLPI